MTDERHLPSTADHVGQAAGGITGVVAGAALGATAGPVGVLLGGIAGAIGGWWSGRAISEAAEDITQADDDYYRADFDAEHDRRLHERRQAGRYEDVRAAYVLGDIAAANPEYARFEDLDQDMERLPADSAARAEWVRVRAFTSIGFARGRDRRRGAR